MTKLSRTDLAAIYRACDDARIFNNTLILGAELWEKINNFYGYEFGNWSMNTSTRQNERIMALLFWAAAGGEL